MGGQARQEVRPLATGQGTGVCDGHLCQARRAPGPQALAEQLVLLCF